MAVDLCSNCKHFVEIVWYDSSTSKGVCAKCFDRMPTPPDLQALAFLALTTPFKEGDRVEARAGAEVYEGVGVVKDISFSLEHGGTPVYPTFLVRFEEKAHPEVPDEAWYTECCLEKKM